MHQIVSFFSKNFPASTPETFDSDKDAANATDTGMRIYNAINFF